MTRSNATRTERSVANSIIALSQLGGQAGFIGCVGDDRYGLFYENEFAKAKLTLQRAIGIPLDMFTVMFAIGRLPGWIANWKEVWEGQSRIYRPRQVYVGATARDYTPIGQRKPAIIPAEVKAATPLPSSFLKYLTNISTIISLNRSISVDIAIRFLNSLLPVTQSNSQRAVHLI